MHPNHLSFSLSRHHHGPMVPWCHDDAYNSEQYQSNVYPSIIIVVIVGLNYHLSIFIQDIQHLSFNVCLWISGCLGQVQGGPASGPPASRRCGRRWRSNLRWPRSVLSCSSGFWPSDWSIKKTRPWRKKWKWGGFHQLNYSKSVRVVEHNKSSKLWGFLIGVGPEQPVDVNDVLLPFRWRWLCLLSDLVMRHPSGTSQTCGILPHPPSQSAHAAKTGGKFGLEQYQTYPIKPRQRILTNYPVFFFCRISTELIENSLRPLVGNVIDG